MGEAGTRATRVPALDLSRPRTLHVANVGGAGMSAVATLLAEMGHTVRGHDPAATTPFVGPLRALGVDVATGPDRAPLPAAVEAVVTSTATPADDPDVAAAEAAGAPVLHRSAALAAICAQRTTLAVAGTHGKTTTSALLATILEATGRKPGWVVGAGIAGLGRSATWGGDGPLVVEADESDGTFLSLGAHAAIVTNLEADHLEHWGGFPALRAGFERFVAALDGPAVLCLDDPGAAGLIASAADPVTYGRAEGAAYRVSDIEAWEAGVRFTVTPAEPAPAAAGASGAADVPGAARAGEPAGQPVVVTVPAAPGVHNALNAAAALALAHRLGVPLADGAAALATFRGVARRFEQRGGAAGVTLVDSYDHLPTEVAAALSAAAAGPWRRVVCVFQPHRYSRTEALWREFADAFVDADRLAVTDVYPAGEAPRPGVTGKLLVEAVLEAHPWAEVAYLPRLDDVLVWLRATLRPGDLCLTLGAGDLTGLPPRIQAMLEERG